MENETINKPEILFEYTTKAFEEIIAETIGSEITPCEELKLASTEILSVIIGVTGNINGRILLNTTVATANKLAEFMNFGEPLDNKDDLFIYLSEFANMYCGRMVTYINDRFGKREVWITPPAIFSANDLAIITPHMAT
ncbi:chemotaxis protein CheX, partial [Candidatus Gastranaerophilus sp. (ex Termes propinquus)]